MMLNNPKYSKDVEGIYNSLDESLKKTKPGKAVKESINATKKKPAVK
jgi:hypothetical protein